MGSTRPDQPTQIVNSRIYQFIGCKWAYKRKRGVDGKVEIYKVRPVAKGYSKKSSFDYEETFSTVTMIKCIRILLSIVSYYDYEI